MWAHKVKVFVIMIVEHMHCVEKLNSLFFFHKFPVAGIYIYSPEILAYHCRSNSTGIDLDIRQFTKVSYLDL